jgi:hypothetical protein
MIPELIFLFLFGAVLAWSFRVWILIPVCLVATVAAFIFELSHGTRFAAAVGHGLLTGLAPQVGYGFGLFARQTHVITRSPWVPRSSREASIATLYKRRSIKQSKQSRRNNHI